MMSELAWEWINFGMVLGAAVICVLGLRFVLVPIVRGIARRTDTGIDDTLVDMLSLPIYLAVLLAGAYLALDQLPLSEANTERLGTGAVVAATILGFFTVMRLFNGLMISYVRAAQEREEREVGPYVNMIRKVVNLVLLAVLVTLVLGQLGYQISTILAGLGIAGLAVALAMQDTLGNLFAGFYMLLDQPLKRGDYVKLESGDEGFVEEIGWRNTKIRPWANNIIVIPNSKLAQSVIVNQHLPEARQRVYIACGVSYESDLEHVERVCKEVGAEVMQQVEGSDLEFEPLVRYKEFGDSNINFLAVLQIKDFGAQYRLKHEFIKALHKRFNEEGIEISWPVSKLVPAGRFEVVSGGFMSPPTGT